MPDWANQLAQVNQRSAAPSLSRCTSGTSSSCSICSNGPKRARNPGVKVRENWWTERGSDRYINDLVSLEWAVLYVEEGQ